MDIYVLPALSDNYIYVLRNHIKDFTAVIDPGDAEVVINFLKEKGWSLDVILNTHHHGDHTAGNAALVELYKAQLVAPKGETESGKIKDVDVTVSEGEAFDLAGEPVEIIETPGHTDGPVCFYLPMSRALFAGDTMFSLGCGRLFEGTAEQMYDSFQKLKTLPDETKLYCGHEYTQANGEFALSVFPEIEALHLRMQMVKALMRKGEPSVPVTLGLEKQTNPFCLAEDVKQFALYRKMKDNFSA